jgi:hypothetical protein
MHAMTLPSGPSSPSALTAPKMSCWFQRGMPSMKPPPSFGCSMNVLSLSHGRTIVNHAPGPPRFFHEASYCTSLRLM